MNVFSSDQVLFRLDFVRWQKFGCNNGEVESTRLFGRKFQVSTLLKNSKTEQKRETGLQVGRPDLQLFEDKLKLILLQKSWHVKG